MPLKYHHKSRPIDPLHSVCWYSSLSNEQVVLIVNIISDPYSIYPSSYSLYR